MRRAAAVIPCVNALTEDESAGRPAISAERADRRAAARAGPGGDADAGGRSADRGPPPPRSRPRRSARPPQPSEPEPSEHPPSRASRCRSRRRRVGLQLRRRERTRGARPAPTPAPTPLVERRWVRLRWRRRAAGGRLRIRKPVSRGYTTSRGESVKKLVEPTELLARRLDPGPVPRPRRRRLRDQPRQGRRQVTQHRQGRSQELRRRQADAQGRRRQERLAQGLEDRRDAVSTPASSPPPRARPYNPAGRSGATRIGSGAPRAVRRGFVDHAVAGRILVIASGELLSIPRSGLQVGPRRSPDRSDSPCAAPETSAS